MNLFFRVLSLGIFPDVQIKYISRQFGTLSHFNVQLLDSLLRNSSLPLMISSRGKTKQVGGATKNGRKSKGKRLGLKKFDESIVRNGQIIARQRGLRWHPGENVGRGKDDTLFALVDGILKFTRTIVKAYTHEKFKTRVFANIMPHKHIVYLQNY